MDGGEAPVAADDLARRVAGHGEESRTRIHDGEIRLQRIRHHKRLLECR